MNKINLSYVSTIVHLSCEEYTNNGATYEMYKEVIESIRQPYKNSGYLQCERSGINSNPCVTYFGIYDEEAIDYIIEEVEDGIRNKLGLKPLPRYYCNQ